MKGNRTQAPRVGPFLSYVHQGLSQTLTPQGRIHDESLHYSLAGLLQGRTLEDMHETANASGQFRNGNMVIAGSEHACDPARQLVDRYLISELP
jgi:hypothetical protein